MKKITAFFFALMMIGCAHKTEIVKPEITNVKQVEYVIRIPPKEVLEIPPQVANIDVDKAKQGDIARWLLVNEERMRLLENKLIEIASFFKVEQDKLNKQANEENKKALEKAAEDIAAKSSRTIDKDVKR